MSKINLHEFKGDTFERIRQAMLYLREHPGSTLTVDPGVYTVSTPLSREIQESVMNGSYGFNPQLIMFQPNFKYDKCFDFDGHRNTCVKAYGAKFIIDGFMETVSFKNCVGCELSGAVFDCLRKPYSRGTVVSQDNNIINVEFGEAYPISEGMPLIRCCIWEPDGSKYTASLSLSDMVIHGSHSASFCISGKGSERDYRGKVIYIWHTFHSRPTILIENAVQTVVKDVTVHSHPGMAITGQRAKDIYLKRFRVVPAEGEFMSTNTDATHFASCRGKIVLDSCHFEGQGDDGTNVHTYYYNIVETDGNRAKLSVEPPDGTHAQSPDFPEVGDTMELTTLSELEPVDTYKVLDVVHLEEYNKYCVTFDRPLPENLSGFCFADSDAVPELEIKNCVMKHHLARGAVIRCRKALVENCLFEDIGDAAIRITSEASWREGICTGDITVRGCKMVDCGGVEGICGGIFMYMETDDRSKMCHKLLKAENNYISCPDARHAMFIDNVQKAVLCNNDVQSREEPIHIGAGVKAE